MTGGRDDPGGRADSGGDAAGERSRLERAAYSPQSSEAESRRALERLAALRNAPISRGEPAEPVEADDPAPARRRVGRLRLLAAAVAAIALVVLAFTAGTQSADHRRAAESSRILATAERTSPIGRALARAARSSDLPLGFQPGTSTTFAGDSYRLLFDASPGSPSTDPRWRVYVGLGVDPGHLCLVAAYDETRTLLTCSTRRHLLTGTTSLTSPVGPSPLSLTVTSGTLTVAAP